MNTKFGQEQHRREIKKLILSFSPDYVKRKSEQQQRFAAAKQKTFCVQTPVEITPPLPECEICHSHVKEVRPISQVDPVKGYVVLNVCNQCYKELALQSVADGDCCDILEKHHEIMQDDPEHLSTNFIKRLSKCNCKNF